MQTPGGLDEFRCFTLEDKDTRWFVYWVNETKCFGVTDGMNKVFECEMDRIKRRKFLGNIADNLLEDDWRDAFDRKSFIVKELDDDHLAISYVLQKQILERVRVEDASQRISELLYFAICSLNKKAHKSTDLISSTSLKTKKPVPKSENHSLIDPSKRKRHRPTGLHFED